jgi:3,4-dihydroxy 2-butanone 4-phosphate synthase / GTP cyclohydrolase II
MKGLTDDHSVRRTADPAPGGAWLQVRRALQDVAAGKPVVVLDDASRENEGDLIFAAEKATAELVSFMVRHTSGYICVALPGSECDRLDLPPMHHTNADGFGTAFTVTVDAKHGVTTGISAADRAYTIGLLARPSTSADDLVRPGHVLPLRAVDGGVLRRPGHTEAAVDLTRMAGLRPAGVLCEVVSTIDNTAMACGDELREFAREHALTMVSIAELISYRRRFEKQAVHVASTQIPTRHGVFVANGYVDTLDGGEHIAMVRGNIGDGTNVLVRVHSECLTGDVFGSQRCDCGPLLDASLQAVAAEDRGALLYIRGQEGRDTGVMHKLRTYQLQETGADAIDARLALGVRADARDYGIAAQILADLGVRSMRLLSNNPDEQAGLEEYGLRVLRRVGLRTDPMRENLRYLCTKPDRIRHELPHLDATRAAAADLHAGGAIA